MCSLPTRQVYNAIKSICCNIRRLQQKRTQSKGLFAVHKNVRWLDRMGQGTSRDFINISEQDLLTFLRLELFQNTVFTVGSRVYRQVRGVAIGGTASAQCASLFCMWKEYQALKWPKRYNKGMSAHLPPHMLPLLPYRYRDNIVGILNALPGYTIKHVMSFMQPVYGLKLQIEAVGHTMTTLESVVNLHPGTHNISLQWKHKNPPMPHKNQIVIRFVDAYSINCRTVLKGMVHSAAMSAEKAHSQQSMNLGH